LFFWFWPSGQSVVYILGFLFIWKILGGNSAGFLQTPFFVFLGILTALVLEEIRLWKKYFSGWLCFFKNYLFRLSLLVV